MCVITAKKSSTTGLCQYARRSVAQNFKLVRRKGVEKRKVERRRRARWKAVRGEKKIKLHRTGKRRGWKRGREKKSKCDGGIPVKELHRSG